MKKIKSFLMVFCFVFLFLLQTGAAPEKVQAATTVQFNDGSGRYLLKNGSNWYLKDKEGKLQKGIQDLKIAETIQEGTRKIYRGYYYFESNGALRKTAGAIYTPGVKVNGKTFKGYYYTTQSGRVSVVGDYFVYIKSTVNNRSFNGVYYVLPTGDISIRTTVRYMKACTLNGVKYYSGFYHFYAGKLQTTKHIAKDLNLKSTGVVRTFKGNYYFGGSNGMLAFCAGWHKLGNYYYYCDKTGLVATNQWIGDYYVTEYGRRAVSCAVPGGYVDCDGRRSTRSAYKLSGLTRRVQERINQAGGLWGIYVQDLKTGDVLCINENVHMYPASVMKAYVMAATYANMASGGIQDKAAAESTIAQMIRYSDNNCHNKLLTMQTPSGTVADGLKYIDNWLAKNGFAVTRDHHTLHPSTYASQSDGSGLHNVTTAREGALLMTKIYKGTCVNAYYSNLMKQKLLDQQVKGFLSGKFPAGAVVADKPGNTIENYNDIAIVWGPKTDFVISVFTENVPYAVSQMNDVALMVYNELER